MIFIFISLLFNVVLIPNATIQMYGVAVTSKLHDNYLIGNKKFWKREA